MLATTAWPTNGWLIADCAVLGYLRPEWRTLDCTYGKGTFWTEWRPNPGCLIGTDINPARSPWGESVDFTDMPFEDGHFDCVVFDPPYKLNGTDQGEGERYGVDTPTPWQLRVALILRGMNECARVLGGGYLLVKCQDQVCSGKVRWQTDIVTRRAGRLGLRKVDRFDMLGGRPQPDGRRQIHARRNSSTLLVFAR